MSLPCRPVRPAPRTGPARPGGPVAGVPGGADHHAAGVPGGPGGLRPVLGTLTAARQADRLSSADPGGSRLDLSRRCPRSVHRWKRVTARSSTGHLRGQAAPRLQKANYAQRPSAAVTRQDGRRPWWLRGEIRTEVIRAVTVHFHRNDAGWLIGRDGRAARRQGPTCCSARGWRSRPTTWRRRSPAIRARMELQVAIGTIFSRLPGLHIAVPGNDLTWQTGIMMRGLAAFPVAWLPSAGYASDAPPDRTATDRDRSECSGC